MSRRADYLVIFASGVGVVLGWYARGWWIASKYGRRMR